MRSLPRIVFFALLAAAFWALRPRQRRRARWFEAQADRAARRRCRGRRRHRAGATNVRADIGTGDQPAPFQWAESGHGILPVTAPATIGGLEVTTVLAPQSHYARMAEAGASAERRRGRALTRGAAPSMEELIDLEQQAEFFVVLGQDEAAVALLTAHLSETARRARCRSCSCSRSIGAAAIAARTRRSARTTTTTSTPSRPSGAPICTSGRSLEDYPQTIARLQALWPTPLHAMRDAR